MPQRLSFHVDGLDCAEEVLLLRQELEGRPGVQQLDFDVLHARMTISLDRNAVTADDVVTYVARTGMHARLWEDSQAAPPASWWRRHGRLLTTCLSGAGLGGGWLTHAVWSKSLLAAFGYAADGRMSTVPFLSRALYLSAVLVGISYVAPKAWNSLRRLRPDMNLLMTAAVVGALILGEWLEAAVVTFLFALSLLLEQWSLDRTRRAISKLLDISPPTAQCIQPETGEVQERPVEDVAVGTTVRVRPGEKIPLDGRVLNGTSAVNQAPITGESSPASKQPGDDVFAGTINEESTLDIEVTKPAYDTTLARIVHMVQEAHSRRAPSEQWVETFARYYTPAMLALAVVIAVVPPLWLAWQAGGVSSLLWSDWFYRGLVVLVIACPCALVISTPVSIVSALAAAAHQGVLVKGGKYLEAMAHLNALAVDKTGTLTHGKPVVQQIVPFNDHTEQELLERAAAMESHSQHPLAHAILFKAQQEAILVTPANDYRILPGKGAEAVLDGRLFWIGSHRLMHEKAEEPPEIHEQAVALEDAGHSVVALGNSHHICGLISMADEVREDVPQSIRALTTLGIRPIVMLTGDNNKTAQEVARATGIDDCRAELLPEDKVREIKRLRDTAGNVAMLGDGINDAPAMAASTVGIAMGAAGSDTAIETADVALMADDLSKLPWLIQHARRTLSIIKQNIGFALGLKLLFVVLTFAGAASLWAAIAADTGASLLVIFNGLRLLRA